MNIINLKNLYLVVILILTNFAKLNFVAKLFTIKISFKKIMQEVKLFIVIIIKESITAFA